MNAFCIASIWHSYFFFIVDVPSPILFPFKIKNGAANTSAYARPWCTPVPPLSANDLGAKAEIEFPSEDESTGSVMMGWRGGAWVAFKEALAISILANYLCRTPVSPLQKVFVETEEDPLCNDVYFGKLSQVEYMYYFKFDNVDTDRLNEVQFCLLRMFLRCKSHHTFIYCLLLFCSTICAGASSIYLDVAKTRKGGI